MQEKSQKKSVVKQNILQIIDIKGISKYEFYKKTRITRGVLDQNNGMSEENIARFLACFTEIDANWLITGEGNMYRNTSFDQLPDQSDVIKLLKDKIEDQKGRIEDQQKIINLLEDKIEILQGGSACGIDADNTAVAG